MARRKMNQPYDGANDVSSEKYALHTKPPNTTWITHTHTPAVNQSVHRLQLRPCVSVVSDLPASVSVGDVSSQHSTNHEAQKNHLRTQREALQHFHIAITLMSSHASDVMKQEAALLTVNVIDQ